MAMILAAGGRARADIVIAPQADRVVRFAACELRDTLKKISGAPFRILRRDPASFPGPAITIQADPGPAPLNAPDAYSLETRAGQVRIRGNRGRSALYGVYELLEALGCRFVEPGLDVVPHARALTLPALSRRRESAFSLRNVFRIQILKSKTYHYRGLEPNHHLPQVDWMAKRRLNHYIFYIDYYRYDLWEKYKHEILDALLDRGFDLEVTHHSLHYFCPPDENHDYGGYGPSTYRSTHPDWYVGTQIRIEKPAVQAVVLERYLDYIKRNPELSRVGLWPADDTMNASTDAFLKFWNTMGTALASRYPEKQLSILAYLEILKPPRHIKPAPNLHCWFCPIRSNYMYPLGDRRNRENLVFMRDWVRRMAPRHVACFEYYGWQSVLTPFAGKMKADLTAYRNLGLGGVYGWAGFTFNLMGTDYRWARDLYVLSHLLWNPDQPTAPLEAEWAHAVFGRAAGGILAFYGALRRAHDKERARGLLSSKPWISLELLHALQKILAGARRKAESPAARRRVGLLEKLACQGSTDAVLRKPPSSIESAF